MKVSASRAIFIYGLAGALNERVVDAVMRGNDTGPGIAALESEYRSVVCPLRLKAFRRLSSHIQDLEKMQTLVKGYGFS
ncbi:hypothetical protein MK489_23320 [Myxococcota bacterium]|nr:hypothetical protein [Myxococcota bacterium]